MLFQFGIFDVKLPFTSLSFNLGVHIKSKIAALCIQGDTCILLKTLSDLELIPAEEKDPDIYLLSDTIEARDKFSDRACVLTAFIQSVDNNDSVVVMASHVND